MCLLANPLGASKSGKTSPPTIDLTSEDDEDMKKAMQASLEDQGPTFRPSDRAPHPDWAVVPSNVSFFHSFLELMCSCTSRCRYTKMSSHRTTER